MEEFARATALDAAGRGAGAIVLRYSKAHLCAFGAMIPGA